MERQPFVDLGGAGLFGEAAGGGLQQGQMLKNVVNGVFQSRIIAAGAAADVAEPVIGQ
jgi:hypothetical protein